MKLRTAKKFERVQRFEIKRDYNGESLLTRLLRRIGFRCGY